MYFEVFKHEEMFDLRFKTLNGNKNKHDSSCPELYAIIQAASDIFKS